MPTYAYQAVDGSGKRMRGHAQAVSTGALTRTLEERGLLVLDVAESADGAGGAPRISVRPAARSARGDARDGGAAAGRHAARAGAERGVGRRVGRRARRRSTKSAAASNAARRCRRRSRTIAISSRRIYVGLVRAGEKSGDLDSAFARLADQLERDEQLRGKVLSASIYPLLLATRRLDRRHGAALLRAAAIRHAARGERREAAAGRRRRCSRCRRRCTGAWPVLLLIPFVIAAFAAWVANTDEGRRVWSATMLALPGVSTLRRYALAGRFARLVGVLLGGGAPLLAALDDTVESIGDPIARDDACAFARACARAARCARAVAESTLFPPMLAQLVGVGEDAGQLQVFLMKAADIFEERTERATQRLATLAEPAMIVVFGAIVAFVALSLLQAIYGINANSFK